MVVNDIFSSAIFCSPLILEAVFEDVDLIVLAEITQSVSQLPVRSLRNYIQLTGARGRISHMTSSAVPFFQQGVTTNISLCLCCGPHAVSRAR
jgi:hypothetical protein